MVRQQAVKGQQQLDSAGAALEGPLEIFHVALPYRTDGVREPPEAIAMRAPGLKPVADVDDRLEVGGAEPAITDFRGHILSAVADQDRLLHVGCIHQPQRMLDAGRRHVARDSVLALYVGVENVQMSINDAKPRRRRGALALDSEPASRGQRCRSES